MKIKIITLILITILLNSCGYKNAYFTSNNTIITEIGTSSYGECYYITERGVDASITDFFTSNDVILYDSCGKFQIGDTIKLTK